MYIIYKSKTNMYTVLYCNVRFHVMTVMTFFMQPCMKLYDASDEYKSIDEDKGNRALD